METLADRFNKHLDRCPQCKNNPFNLCGIGQVILNAVVAAGMVSAQQSVQSDGAKIPAENVEAINDLASLIGEKCRYCSHVFTSAEDITKRNVVWAGNCQYACKACFDNNNAN